jgi:hypothetical protein
MSDTLPAPTNRGLYVALRKGAAIRDHRVRRLVRRMRESCPWLLDSDGPACWAWAELELLATVIYARLHDEGLTTESGEPKKLLGEYRSVRHSQLAFAKELGLTPAARRQLAESGKAWTRDLHGGCSRRTLRNNRGTCLLKP